MDAHDPAADLVVTTPERISFDYQLAGAGSRFLAQLVDAPVQLAIAAVAAFLALGVYLLVRSQAAAFVILAVLVFFDVWGYFAVSEAVWSGRTLGKLVFGLRVVGDRGEPVRVSQALIRNLVRIADFLPVLYAIGVIALFVGGRGKRLGDLVAGTVVVRERASISLSDLVAGLRAPAAPPPPAAHREEPAALRQLDPELRRFVEVYCDRRPYLSPWQRWSLAARIEPALRRHSAAEVTGSGPLAVLDRLADLDAAGRS
jgi:uncharacterized RDD family membrane protein YckC